MQDSQRRPLEPGSVPIAIVGISITIFMVGFAAVESDGLWSFAQWLARAARAVPGFLESIVDYYRHIPGDYLLQTLVIGGVIGFAGTLLLHLRSNRGKTWQESLNPDAILIRRMLLGTGGGMIGAQILTYSTQHCTYYADAPASQYRMGLLITAFSALLVLLPLWTLMFRRRQIGAEAAGGFFRDRVTPYVLLIPSLLILMVFLYYPGIQIVLLSLKARRFPLPQERFVCLNNYVSLSSDMIYQNSLTRTFFITIMVVILTMGAALLIAVMASQKIRYASVYRTLLIWPFALSPVVSGVIFLAMFREGGAGVINAILDSTLGIKPGWLHDSNLAPWVIILASVWNGLGFNILFYIAGLQNVPADLLEAAAMDGANRVQRFVRITVPLLSPFTFFLLVANVTYAFYGIYGVVDATTQGGPPLGPGGIEGGATDVLIYKLYQDAFGPGSSAGMAAAQALILFILVATMTLLQFRYLENRVTYNA